MLIAGSAQTLLGIILGEYSEFTIQTDGLLAILYLIFFGSLLGYVSYIYAIAKLPVSFVSTYAYINPIIAVLLGWMVIDESLSTTIVISTMIILSGVLLLQKGIYRQRGAER
jgi:drug/metabolite transporter (DMT)-like permease